jgi:hypothetical protein
MKSQALKLFAIAFVLGLITIFALAGSASAQDKSSFETSFDFQVGKEKFAAGKYDVTTLGYGRYLLKNAETQDKILVASQILAGDDSTKQEKLVFNRYGESYFLRQIFVRRGSAGIELAESGVEKNIRKGNRENEIQLAKKQNKPESV